MKQQRIYTTTVNGQKRYVRASARANAILHVADGVIEASVASHDELIDAVRRGVVIEEADGDVSKQLPIEA